MSKPFGYLDDLSRRRFVTCAARTFLGVGVMSPLVGSGALAAATPPTLPRNRRAKNVIYLFMAGGMSHLDTFDPKPGSETQGPVGAIDTRADGVRLSEHLPLLAGHMDKVALVRSLTSKSGAHERGQYYMRTSYNPLATIRHPALGAWVLNLGEPSRSTLPGNVVVSGPSDHPGAGFMAARYAPAPIGDPNKGLQNSKLPEGVAWNQFERRMKLVDRFDRDFRRRYPHQKVRDYTDFYDDAVRLMTSRDLLAFDLSREPQPVREAYGQDRFGQGVLLARRLVQHGVRFVEVDFGGWDTHENNFERVPERAAVLDRALATLLEDLSAKGLLSETLVVVATEFGRTPKINDRNGRDHHPRVFSGLIGGGPVRSGMVYGASDPKGHDVEENAVEIPDFNATIAYALGLPLDRRVTSPSGRPFTVADKGAPVTALF